MSQSSKEENSELLLGFSRFSYSRTAAADTSFFRVATATKGILLILKDTTAFLSNETVIQQSQASEFLSCYA